MNLLFLLLAISAWINYMDRGNLGVAAPVLGPELGLGPAQIGLLLSSFFWTYSLMQPVGGYLVDRFNVYKVYAIGFAVWSLAVAAAAMANGLPFLLVTRLALGVGECIAYPSYSRIITMQFPEGRRGFANAVIDVGTKAGPAIGTLVGGWMVGQYGWRPFFLVMGLLSLVWLGPWLWVTRGSGGAIKMERRATMNPMILIVKRQAWATFIGLFGFNYTWYFLLTWLPGYLVKERHFSMQLMSIYGSLPFVATAIAALSMGYLSDKWIRDGASINKVRKTVVLVGLVLCAVMLPIAAIAELNVAMVAMVLAFIGIGFVTSNLWAISQAIAGANAAGTWTGLQNAVGNMGGVAAPLITGMIVQKYNIYLPAFYVCSAMLLLSAVCYGPLLGTIRPDPELAA